MTPVRGCVCSRCFRVSRGEADPGRPTITHVDAYVAFAHLAAAIVYTSGVRTRLNATLAASFAHMDGATMQKEALIMFFVLGHEVPTRPGVMKEVLPC
jgi:hypothetical protein